jgi:hypothetical protein
MALLDSRSANLVKAAFALLFRIELQGLSQLIEYGNTRLQWRPGFQLVQRIRS